MHRALLLPCLVLAGCGASASGAVVPRVSTEAHVQLDAGLTVGVPAGWSLATRLTALAGPAERFTLSSSRLPSGEHDNCGPAAAVMRLPADGVLAFVLEYRARDGGHPEFFPPRSRGLRLPPGPPAQFECFGRGRSFGFRVARRDFQVNVAVGPRAPHARVARLLRALQTMRVSAREP